MTNGSKKSQYINIGLLLGFLFTAFKILYTPFFGIDLRFIASLSVDYLFFSYVSAGSTYILWELFIRRKKEELDLNYIIMIITFILSLSVYSELKLLFLSPF